MIQILQLTNPHSAYTHLRDASIWLGVIGCWASLGPWIVWMSPNITMGIMMLFFMSRLPFIDSKIDYATLISIGALTIFGFIYAQFFVIGIKSSIFQIINIILPLYALLLFNSKEKIVFLNRLINWFSIILAVSIIWYFFHLFIDLPNFIYNSPNPAYSPFKNYLFFIIESNNDLGWLTRFQAIYTEPGHLAMASAILLYINGYSLKKWQNIALTVALIWSFSLAGFVLYFVGVVLFYIAKSKHLSLTIFKIVIGTAGLIGLGMAYYSPSNNDMISVMILSRLQFDESKGISGNNRNSAVFEEYYERFLTSEQFPMGIGRVEMDRVFTGTGNSSYKNYIVNYGLIGTLATFFLMGCWLFCYPSRKGMALMLLLCVSFIQRPYFIWAIECMPYIAALVEFKYSKQPNKPNVATYT